ncbi:hypothetical protein PV328_007730 [Microctonus aethiopoides]|uniref:Uncharacterized protein n=1 Tax=Microctonus aethiopoides TaxID=144406 RepID=A0AA39C9T5_9HYME|nr:hypothetical protein PV328_007730 [Microctonus aethiopoides]
MNSASDYTYLALKVILIFGISGALRCEISKLKLQDVENLGNKYLIHMNGAKNDVPRQFIIGELFNAKVKHYISIRSNEQFTNRIFIKYYYGKCQQQPSTSSSTDDYLPEIIIEKNDNKSKDVKKDSNEFSEFEMNDDLAKLHQCEESNRSQTHFRTTNNEKILINSTNYEASEQISNSFSTNLIDKNPFVKYENCLFHGNIINNYHYSCDHKKDNTEK